MKKKQKTDIRLQTGSAEKLLQELINDYATTEQLDLEKAKKGLITEPEFFEKVREHIRFTYNEEEETSEQAIAMLQDYIFGYSRLTPLINDPEISDIRCIAYDNIRIKKKGQRMDSGIRFESAREYENFVSFVATRNKVNVSNLNAIQRFTDNESSEEYILRFTVAMPLVNTYNSPYLCIRKVPKNFPSLKKLVQENMLSEELAEVIKTRFSNGSTLICGGNSSGKTTLLNALKEELPKDMSILVAQQADELTTKKHPDSMFLHSLPGSSESSAQYDLKNISIAGLTMDVDFFIIGEIKGDEAIYLLNAAYTGQLSAGTIHAPSAAKAVNKTIDYAMAASRYQRVELMKMMDCFDTIIFMKKYKVDQVYAVKGFDYEKQELTYEPIWENGGFTKNYAENHTDI